MLTRRAFLARAGLLITAAAGGGLTYRAVDNGVFKVGEGSAYAPWSALEALTGTPVDLVRAAILAANPHNTQPWLFKVTENQIDLYADLNRTLGAIDPYQREQYAGLGCALANMLIAAPALGYTVDYTLRPTASDETHAAQLKLTAADPVPSPLFEAIPHRHTNRYAYRHPEIEAEVLNRVSAYTYPEVQVIWITEADAKQRLGDLMVKATEAIIDDDEQSKASFAWQRQSWDDIQSHRDGITLDCAGLDEFTTVMGKLLPPSSREQSDSYWLSSIRERQVPTAAAFGIICLNNIDDLAQRIQGGLTWQSMHLQMTVEGLAAQPLNAIPERISREQVLGTAPYFQDATAEIIGTDQQALMMFRVGYPTETANLAPRRDDAEVIIGG
jgi:nitroreductase